MASNLFKLFIIHNYISFIFYFNIYGLTVYYPVTEFYNNFLSEPNNLSFFRSEDLLCCPFWPLLSRSLTVRQSITHSISHSLTQSVTHSPNQSLTHSISHSLTQSVTHSLTQSVTHSLYQSLTCSDVTKRNWPDPRLKKNWIWISLNLSVQGYLLIF